MMDKLTLIHEAMEATATAVRRRGHHVSPYKKSLNQANNATNKLIANPSDANIRAWASKILVKTLGTKALKLSDTNTNEIRTAAILLGEIDGYNTTEQINLKLIEAARYSINNAQEQMQALIQGLKLDADKEKVSTQQMIHDKIGSQLLLDKSNESSMDQKQVDTRTGMR